jgi:coproporphyrinogen III oxidase-like Fe-S oxidoreductase
LLQLVLPFMLFQTIVDMCTPAAAVCHLQEEQLLDVIMLSLRLSDGLALQQLQREYGQETVASLLPTIQSSLQTGLMQLVPCGGGKMQHTGVGSKADSTSSNGTVTVDADAAYAMLCDALKQGKECGVRLTDPAGFLLSNDVISEFFALLDSRTLSKAL